MEKKDKKEKKEKKENEKKEKRKQQDEDKNSDMAEPSENQKLAKAKSSPNTKASKAPKLDADLDAEAVHDANDLPSEAEDATDLLGVDGVDDSELGELQAVGLVADANAVRHNPWQQWQDASQDLTEQVALQGDEPEFLNDQRHHALEDA